MPTGTMEIARDGTVINETHTQALGPQGAETELAERDKRLLENIQARIADSEEYKAKYEMFKAPFEAYLRTPPEQRKVCDVNTLPTADPCFTHPRARFYSVLIRATSSGRNLRSFWGTMMGSSRCCPKLSTNHREPPFK